MAGPYIEKSNGITEGLTTSPSSDADSAQTQSVEETARQLSATVADILAAQEHARTLSVQETRILAKELVHSHHHDPNFPSGAIDRLKSFIEIADSSELKEGHSRIIRDTKIEVSLYTTNSPYAEVRSVVDATDDPNLPVSTIRSWVIGIGFVILSAFVTQLFSVRQPTISLGTAVVQLLAYPLGKAAERFLPDVGFTLWGVRHSLNPGPFNKKEHMLISIFANVGHTLPSTRNIIFTQWLDVYFGQAYAKSFAYQILLALSSNLMGFGLAGLCRRFLVYPAFCIWPASLVTIALNSSLHHDRNDSVPGPFRKMFSLSRFKFFMYAFAAMSVWFWFPDYIFEALSLFNWLAWIAPTNFNLTAITGVKKGLGFNPFPTFDWNVATHSIDPLVIPYHVTVNTIIGAVIGGITIIGLYWTNAYHSAYLPINSNTMYNHNGTSYVVSKVLDEHSFFDLKKYQAYSPVFIAASSITFYYFSFAIYASTISYAYLYHRHDIMMGFRSLVGSFQQQKRTEGSEEQGEWHGFKDVHSRLMSVYREVPEWWYAILNVLAIAFGVAAVAGWPTYTNVGVVFFGIALALVFVVPAGILEATTGVEIEFNVLAEFIGGGITPGNALAMNFFKCYGYVTVAHALHFANDLKLAHYVKIPQRHTYMAQVAAVVVSAFVATGVMNFQMRNIPNLCESTQKDRFTCPGVNSYFTASVLFGSIGARRVFGTNGQYTTLLSAFPVGFVLPIIFHFVQKRVRKSHWIAKAHPVILLNGASSWSPYNIAYIWPAVIPGWLSMVYIRGRYLAFWSKYNYVLSAAFSAAIAISGVLIFFIVEYNSYEIKWWGNDSESGCESVACTRLKLPKGTYFGPRIGTYA